MSKSVPLKRIYCSGNELVTEGKLESDPNYKLASITDVEDYGCLGVHFKDCVIEVLEGRFAWWESHCICVLSDMNTYDCGYVKVG